MPETSDPPLPSLTTSDVDSLRARFSLDRKVVDYLVGVVKAYPTDIRGYGHVELAFLSGRTTLARDLLALANKLGEADGK